MRRLLRIIWHRILIALGKADTTYSELPFDAEYAKQVGDKVMDKDYQLYNVGYSEKHGGHILIAIPLNKNKQAN